MTNVLYNNFPIIFIEQIDNPVFTYPDPIQIFSTSYLLQPMWKWLNGKRFDVLEYSFNHCFRYFPEVFFDRMFETQIIFFHS